MVKFVEAGVVLLLGSLMPVIASSLTVELPWQVWLYAWAWLAIAIVAAISILKD